MSERSWSTRQSQKVSKPRVITALSLFCLLQLLTMLSQMQRKRKTDNKKQEEALRISEMLASLQQQVDSKDNNNNSSKSRKEGVPSNKQSSNKLEKRGKKQKLHSANNGTNNEPRSIGEERQKKIQKMVKWCQDSAAVDEWVKSVALEEKLGPRTVLKG